MDETKPILPEPSGATPLESTWGERLLMNLVSYSFILVPMAIIILATRYRLFPSSIQSSTLLQRFVYGTVQHSKIKSIDESDEKLLLQQNDSSSSRRSNLRRDSSNNRSALSLLWCFLGLQLSYLIWGVLQEKIMTTEYPVTSSLTVYIPEKSTHFNSFSDNSTKLNINDKIITFHDSQFLVFVNRLIAFILSIVALVHNRPKQSPLFSTNKYLHQEQTKPQAPLYEYIYCSLSNILSSWCQYEALKYVNFPTQVLSKTCKLIPVMLMSKIMLRKRYQYSDYFCALLLSVGMFIFIVNQPADQNSAIGLRNNSSLILLNSTMARKLHEDELPLGGSLSHFDEISRHVQNNSLISGLVILALYLTFDSFTSNWQQNLFTQYGISNWQMMAATNFYSILLTLTSLHQLGNLKPAFKLLASSTPLLVDCLMMSIMSSIGQLFVYYTIKRFGSVIFTVIMTLRQFIAILLSCSIYGHRLTFGSSIGLFLVFCIVGFQMWRKSSKTTGNTSNTKTQLPGFRSGLGR